MMEDSKKQRIYEFIPRKRRTLAILLGAGVGFIIALCFVDIWARELVAMTGGAITQADIAPLTLDGSPSLISWCTMILLSIAAGLSWTVFLMRQEIRGQHLAEMSETETDKPPGKSKLWAWTAGWFLLLALASWSAWHLLCAKLITHVAGSAPMGTQDYWWLVPAFLVFAALGLRWWGDLYPRNGVRALMVAGGVLLAMSVALNFGIFPLTNGLFKFTLTHTLEPLGFLVMTVAVLAYAQSLCLELCGEIERQPFKVGRVKKQETDKSSEKDEKREEKKLAKEIIREEKRQRQEERRLEKQIAKEEAAERRLEKKLEKEIAKEEAKKARSELDLEKQLLAEEKEQEKRKKKEKKKVPEPQPEPEPEVQEVYEEVYEEEVPEEQEEETQWTDGGESYDDYNDYDDDDDYSNHQPKRKMSKSQRKALRRKVRREREYG